MAQNINTGPWSKGRWVKASEGGERLVQEEVCQLGLDGCVGVTLV